MIVYIIVHKREMLNDRLIHNLDIARKVRREYQELGYSCNIIEVELNNEVM